LFLLDECLWPGLASALPPFDCRTVWAEGWSGLTDSELIERARGRYTAILTSDRRFGRSRSLTPPDPAIVILGPRLDRPDHMLALAPAIIRCLSGIQQATVAEVCWWD